MLPDSMIRHLLKPDKFVKLLLLTALSLIIFLLLLERIMLWREAKQIKQTLQTFALAMKQQDIELAYAQCLPPEQGGQLSLSELQVIPGYHSSAISPLYLKIDLDLLRSKLRPTWIEGKITLEANINGTVIYDSPSTVHLRALLRKWDNHWYIIKFAP